MVQGEDTVTESGVQLQKRQVKTNKQVIFDGKGKSGKLLEWKVEERELVKAHTVLGIIQTSQHTSAIRTKYPGTIFKLYYQEGDEILDG